MSRGLENRNPGNIRRAPVRYKGEVRPSRDPDFKEFESLAWGYRAIFVLLDTYRTRYGIDTLRGMISRWAPPSENRTEAYIRAVADDTGLDPDKPLDTRDRKTMVPWPPRSRAWRTACRPKRPRSSADGRFSPAERDANPAELPIFVQRPLRT